MKGDDELNFLLPQISTGVKSRTPQQASKVKAPKVPEIDPDVPFRPRKNSKDKGPLPRKNVSDESGLTMMLRNSASSIIAPPPKSANREGIKPPAKGGGKLKKKGDTNSSDPIQSFKEFVKRNSIVSD